MTSSVAIYFLAVAGKFKAKANLPTAIVCTGLSGVAESLLGIGGSPMVVYFLAAMDDKEEYLATTQFFFFTTGAYTMILRIINGIYTPDRYGDNEEDRLCIFVTFGNCNIIIVNRRHLVYTVYEVGYRGDADGR